MKLHMRPSTNSGRVDGYGSGAQTAISQLKASSPTMDKNRPEVRAMHLLCMPPNPSKSKAHASIAFSSVQKQQKQQTHVLWLLASGCGLETNRIQYVLIGMQNRAFGPYLAAIHRILVPATPP
jgi:hypothetical protein